MKKCFKCEKILSLKSFYKHRQMSDGHLNKCKECIKKDVRIRYYSAEGRLKIIEYEKKRFQTKERKEKARIYKKKNRAINALKYKARNMVHNYLKNKKIFRQPCVHCGSLEVEAHHRDYSKPLEVIWVCKKHHRIIEGKVPFLQGV